MCVLKWAAGGHHLWCCCFRVRPHIGPLHRVKSGYRNGKTNKRDRCMWGTNWLLRNINGAQLVAAVPVTNQPTIVHSCSPSRVRRECWQGGEHERTVVSRYLWQESKTHRRSRKVGKDQQKVAWTNRSQVGSKHNNEASSVLSLFY